MNKKWVFLVGGVVVAATALWGGFDWFTHYTAFAQAKGVTYQTGSGEQRQLTLDDGSSLILDSHTWIHVRFEGGVRDITITRGRAYFEVAEGAQPLRVAGGVAEVKALGGAFEVQVDAQEMAVSVEQGRVAVSMQNDPAQQQEVKALQRVAVIDQQLGSVQEIKELDQDWRDGWLEFEDAALDYVVARLDHYYPGHIWLGEEHLSQLRVSGRYRIANINKAIRILARSMGLEMSISEVGDITLIQRKD